MKIDRSQVTLAQWDDLYRFSPDAYRAIATGEVDAPTPPRVMIGALWLARRQAGEDVTLEQVGDTATVEDFGELVMGDSEAADPT